MNVTITNEKLEIIDPTDEIVAFAKKHLSYVDKAKQYQLKRMSKNPWMRTSPAYVALQREIKGQVYKLESNVLTIPSGFINSFNEYLSGSSYTDKRQETGRRLVLPWETRPYNLRPYQSEVVDMLLDPLRYRGIVNFATGLGKTLTALHFIKLYQRNTLIVCPSDSVAKQFYTQCVDAFGKSVVGFYGGGKKKINDITIGIAASITRNVDDFKKANFGAIIFDEIHHIAADTFFNIAENLTEVGKVFGLTATDYRSDGKDIMITAGCGPVIARRDVKWGIENKFLAEPYFIVREVDTGGKDFKDNKLKNYKEHVLNNSIMKNKIYNDALNMINSSRSVLILVDEVEHGRELSQLLSIPFATGQDSKSQDYVDQLNEGKIKGLVGTDGRIGEGTDTQNVDVLILANFVASKGPVIQAVGRSLRKTVTKSKCLILDYIPLGSKQLTRHAWNRVEYYKEITEKVKIIHATDQN
jgi:superfamily II DNA or RNA helicase